MGRELRAERRESKDEQRESRDERRESRVERGESRDEQRGFEKRDSRDSSRIRQESRNVEEDVDFNPKWNLNLSTFDFYPSSKEVLSQVLLGGIALAMLFKKEGTKTV